MVGVPGRSKGCNTCRKRRVKCDESRPHCKRCVKAKIECLGYERTIQWRHMSSVPFPGQTAEQDGDQALGMSEKNSEASPAPELSLVAFEADFCISFMYENFVWRSYGTPWLEQAVEGKLGELSLQAAKALSQTNFGRSKNVKDVELKGGVLYGKCLRVLADELAKAAILSGGTETLVIPVLVLMMHASLHEDRPGAISHLKGIANMLSVCGPEAFQKQPLRNAFDAARSTLLVASLSTKRRLFLEEPPWHTVSWPLGTAVNPQQSTLLDIFATVPGLLQEHAHLVTFSSPDEILAVDELYENLCDRIAAQLEKLYRWRWKWQEIHGGSVRADQTSCRLSYQTTGSVRESRPLDRLCFDRQVQAGDIILYNAVLMWLLALLWKLKPVHALSRIEFAAAAAATTTTYNLQAAVTFNPLCRPDASVSVRDSAMEICRVFEWLSRNHHTRPSETEPIWLYLLPVGMAMSVLDEEGEEEQEEEKEEDLLSPEFSSGKSWLQHMLNTSPLTSSYGFAAAGKSVAGFGSYLTKEIIDPLTFGIGDIAGF